MVELLAPAGNFESLKQAVFGGANAVYFGVKNFNARIKADNFGDDLLSVVSFCHAHGVKAYLTVNTLVENDQMEELLKTCAYALECGIDAFIVQDFGVLNILKKAFKNIEIHASTQMAVNNYLGAVQAEKMGIKRVVLSRETSINDIKLIKQKTNLQIEYFIQGALCVCFSGNCYLSSALFGKSGNKGECLQPCRLPFMAYAGGKFIKKGYLLSAKDLCFINKLKELSDAGVDSFKIEGRLRRPAYVGGVTSVYRKVIDNNYEFDKKDLEDIKKLFNRGDYVEGYLSGNGGIIDYNIQGHRGVFIGNVISFKKGNKFNVITIKSSYAINKGDGLKFISDNGKEVTITAVDIKQNGNVYTITSTATITTNDKVYLIQDKKLEDEILSREKRLPINFSLKALCGQKLELAYSFKDITGTVFGNVCEKSVNLPLSYEDAKNSLSKLQETNFYLNQFNLKTNCVFVRKQELNELRRLAIAELSGKLQTKKETYVNMNALSYTTIKSKPEPPSVSIGEMYNSKSDVLVIKPKNYQTFMYDKIAHKNAYLYIPSFLRAEDVEIIQEILKKHQNLGVYAENIGALGYKRKTILGAKLNIKNVYALKELINEYVELVVASPEISNNNYDILNLSTTVPVVKANFNNFDLMTLVHCPIKTLFNNNCSNCKYMNNISYIMDNGTKLSLERYVVKNCYFTLKKENKS